MVPTTLVLDLADAIVPRYRALVLVAGFAGLRTDESLGLTRGDIDLLHGEIRVTAQAQEIAGSGRVILAPKSDAGRRTVAIPGIVVGAIEARIPGVTTKELMARIGHASPRAALIYQHATAERDRAIAAFLDAEVAAAGRSPLAPIVGLTENRLDPGSESAV